MQNIERIYEHFAAKLLSAGIDGLTAEDINTGNKAFERKARKIWFDISVGEGEQIDWTEKTERRFITVNVIVGVPAGSGTKRIHNAAYRISKFYSALDPTRAGFKIDNTFYYVKRVDRKSPMQDQDGLKLNVQFVLDTYSKEF